LANELGRDRSISAAHDGLGQTATVAGDEAAAAEHFKRSLSLIRGLGDVDGMLRTMSNQALFLAESGLVDEAGALLVEGTQLAKEAGAEPNRAEIARASGVLGLVSDDIDAAVGFLREARDLFAGIGADVDVAAVDLLLAQAILRSGDIAGAEDLARVASDRLASIGADRWVIEGLDVLAAVAHHRGDVNEATKLLDLADEERRKRGMRRFGTTAAAAAALRSQMTT
jgi:hypothetical protein